MSSPRDIVKECQCPLGQVFSNLSINCVNRCRSAGRSSPKVVYHPNAPDRESRLGEPPKSATEMDATFGLELSGD